MQNGGLIGMDELCARLMEKRGSRSQQISSDDVLQATKKVAILGNGFKVVDVGRRQMVRDREQPQGRLCLGWGVEVHESWLTTVLVWALGALCAV